MVTYINILFVQCQTGKHTEQLNSVKVDLCIDSVGSINNVKLDLDWSQCRSYIL